MEDPEGGGASKLKARDLLRQGQLNVPTRSYDRTVSRLIARNYRRPAGNSERLWKHFDGQDPFKPKVQKGRKRPDVQENRGVYAQGRFGMIDKAAKKAAAAAGGGDAEMDALRKRLTDEREEARLHALRQKQAEAARAEAQAPNVAKAQKRRAAPPPLHTPDDGSVDRRPPRILPPTKKRTGARMTMSRARPRTQVTTTAPPDDAIDRRPPRVAGPGQPLEPEPTADPKPAPKPGPPPKAGNSMSMDDMFAVGGDRVRLRRTKKAKPEDDE